MNEYKKWLNVELEDADLTKELKSIEGNEAEIYDRFYRGLDFGTAGLRGVLGIGTNRMNIYVVRKSTQGLANYLNKNKTEDNIAVAIGYDSRIKADLFAKESATVLAANGIKSYIYPELMPTPAVSYAVRELGCAAGICVTASHNPAKYNGYKVYGSDGCQVTEDMANGIMNEMSKLDIFEDVVNGNFETFVKEGKIVYIGDEIYEPYIKAILNERILTTPASNLSVVYTPLNGSGKKCVLDVLGKIGVTDLTIVAEQSEPDGNFPTCPYPNPEIKEALQKGLDLCEKVKPDILLATDPDCDRVGIAVNQNGEYKLISGNEVGILLLDFIARFKSETNTLPKNPIAVTTVVSTAMVDPIAKDYGIEIKRVLTGFKYIGDQIADLEKDGEVERYLLGFEESYGYLKGGYVRDKDAVNASMLICEMASYYKSLGKTLVDVMGDLYDKYGYYVNDLMNFSFEGADGMDKMSNIMSGLRENAPAEIIGVKVVGVNDYLLSKSVDNGTETVINLPKSNVIEFTLENDAKFIIRPSGTEPKIKVYLSAKAETLVLSKEIIEKMKDKAKDILGI